MQQFALASVYPRSIAWLIRQDEWKRLEKIINYNCAMVGGYFNVIIPLTEHDAISEEYQRFLADYDPDLIVLAPGMTSDQLEPFSNRIQPFGIVSWDLVPVIATLDPLSRGNGMNAAVEGFSIFEKQNQFAETFIAVANTAFPDTSRLALVACGDVEPRTPMLDFIDEDVSLDATGYREHFLARLLANKYDQKYVEAYLEEGQVISAPNRYQLSNIISEEYKFPLSEAVKILSTCFKLQNPATSSIRQSFINLTAIHHRIGGAIRHKKQAFEDRPPAIVILVSDSFSFEEALLFWNLRAKSCYVAWLPFSDLEKEQEAVVKWLDSDIGGAFYWMSSNGSSIAFSSTYEGLSRLQAIVDHLQAKKTKPFIRWNVIKRQSLISYDSIHLPILQERVMVMKNESKYTFAPKLPQGNSLGVFTITLEWNGCMLPRHNQIIQKNVSSEMIKGFERIQETHQTISMPRFRITNEHYLKVQIDNERPLEFNRPSPEQVIKVLFESAGFTRIEQSSAARYHTIFINRAGELDNAAYYLATSPYRELLDILSDNNPKNKTGWLLPNPSRRRALHHLFLRDALGKLTIASAREYFNTVSDEIPAEAFHLLEKELLERGFLLKCRACSFRSWYPAEHIGQTFECARCFQTQVYDSNPLWLYKLPEVIFQGFEDNMQVPILALNYFKRMSQHYFEWVPDSNIYQQVNGEETSGNIDLLCISDGKFYIGEAKSNDEIDAKQFSFYEQICRRVAVDGVVFATSQNRWGKGTQQRIDRLKTWFMGEVLVLTEKDLYMKTDTI